MATPFCGERNEKIKLLFNRDAPKRQDRIQGKAIDRAIPITREKYIEKECERVMLEMARVRAQKSRKQRGKVEWPDSQNPANIKSLQIDIPSAASFAEQQGCDEVGTEAEEYGESESTRGEESVENQADRWRCIPRFVRI